MKTTVAFIAPPVGMQPGGYVAKAYAGHDTPGTARAELEAVLDGNAWRVTLRWEVPAPVDGIAADPRLFCDAAALFAPTVADAPWITMGSPGAPLQGVLWRADRATPLQVHATGLGTVQRSDAPAGWTAAARHAGGRRELVLSLPGFAALEQHRQLAFALWQGARGERAGIKSVSPGWIALG